MANIMQGYSEFEDIQKLYKCVQELRKRVQELEKNSHPPVDFNTVFDTLEKRIISLEDNLATTKNERDELSRGNLKQGEAIFKVIQERDAAFNAGLEKAAVILETWSYTNNTEEGRLADLLAILIREAKT